MNVLLIEDEQHIADFVVQGLAQYGINVVHEADGFTGLNSALSGRHDAIVLDVVLPLLGGFEVLQELRKRQIFTPVVMLSASADLQDKLKSFNLGALDYVPKPFHLEELAARLKLVVELKQDKFEKAISHGGVTLDRFRREVIWQERATLLTQREFSLLECLMQSPGQIFSKQKILQRVWKIDFETGTNLVEVTIQRLRKKITAPNEIDLFPIETIRGIGYRFSGKR